MNDAMSTHLPSTPPGREPAALAALQGHIARIAVTADHVCVLLDDGGVACFGVGTDGQLGVPATGPCTSTRWGDEGRCGLSAQRIPALHAVDVAVGRRLSCAVIDDGTVRCWGDGDSSLGTGNESQPSSTTPLSVVGVREVRQLAVGSGRHACVREVDGSVWCWGDNEFGQMGNGTHWDPRGRRPPEPTATPRRVAGLGRAVDVTAVDHGNCAALDDGTIACWGTDVPVPFCDDAGLCNDTALSPARIASVAGARAVSVGRDAICAITAAGEVDCWGAGHLGALGNGDTQNASTPVRALGVTDAVGIVSRGHRTCAWSRSGRAWCWGEADAENPAGATSRVCDADTGAQCFTTPTELSLRVRHVAMWWDPGSPVGFTCAVDLQGHAGCWGLDRDPVPSAGGGGAATDAATCGYRTEGQGCFPSFAAACASLRCDGGRCGTLDVFPPIVVCAASQ